MESPSVTASQHSGGLKAGGLEDEQSSMDGVLEWISFGVNPAYNLWLSNTAKGARDRISEQGKEVGDEGD